MKHPSPFAVAALALAAGLAAAPAAAQDGHDHDHGQEAAGAGAGALPRFAASSESFELVGVLDGKRLRLYLDHAADNAPVANATLELELGGTKLAVQPHGPGEYEAELAEAPGEGVLTVSASVVAGNESDLLAGELDIHGDAHAHEAAAGTAWPSYVPWALAALFALIAAALGLRRVRAGRGAQA